MTWHGEGPWVEDQKNIVILASKIAALGLDVSMLLASLGIFEYVDFFRSINRTQDDVLVEISLIELTKIVLKVVVILIKVVVNEDDDGVEVFKSQRDALVSGYVALEASVERTYKLTAKYSMFTGFLTVSWCRPICQFDNEFLSVRY